MNRVKIHNYQFLCRVSCALHLVRILYHYSEFFATGNLPNNFAVYFYSFVHIVVLVYLAMIHYTYIKNNYNERRF